jgi:hypothetical protein
MRHEPDVSVADWFVEAPVAWWTKALYGPPGFDAYARVPIDATGEISDVAVMDQVLAILAPQTTTPELTYAGIWTGWGMGANEPVGQPFSIPNRDYVLVQSALKDILSASTLGLSREEGGDGASPHLIWPADRAWFVAFDVDPEWLAVGGTHAAIESLLSDGVLHAARSTYGSHLDIEW